MMPGNLRVTIGRGLALGAAVLTLGMAGSAAGVTEPDVLFHGARLGMARGDLLALPDLVGKTLDCSHINLIGPPRNTRVGLCIFINPAPSGAQMTVNYLMSTDPQGIERVINMSIRGGPADAEWAMERLKAKFGAPSYTARRRGPLVNGQPQYATVWAIAGKQVMYRERCKAEVNFCVDFSDSQFARSVTQQLGDI